MTAQATQTAGASQADLAGAARSGALSLAGAGAAAIGGFLLTTVVTRGLGPAGAGVFFQAFALFTILGAIGTFGADTGLLYTATRSRPLKRVAELRRSMAIALGPTALVSVAISLSVYFSAGALSRLLVEDRYHDRGVDYFQVMSPFLVLATVGLIAAQATRGFGGLKTYVALQQLALPLGRPLIIGIVLALGLRGLAVPIAWSVPLLVTCPLALYALYRRLRRVERNKLAESEPPRPTGTLAREFWAYSSSRGFAQAFTLSIVWIQIILVGAMVGAHEAGVYAAASRFVTTGTLVMQAMRLAIQPQLGAALAVGEKKRAEDLYRVTTQWIIASSWPLYLVLAAFGPQILRLFGDDFSDGATPLAILSISMLFQVATGNVNTVLLMAGKSRWNAANTVVALIINIGLNILLIPEYGSTGAAIAWAASIVGERAMGMYEVRILLGMRGYGRGSVVAMVSSALVYAAGGYAVRLVFGTDLVPFLTYLVVASLLYMLLLLRFREALDLTSLMAIVRRRKVAA